jgi:hypothetical protein
VRGWNDIREFEAQEGRMTTVWIYVDTSKEVGDVDHLKVFATAELADILFDALIVIGPCAYVRRPTFPAGPVVQVRIIVCLLLLTMVVVVDTVSATPCLSRSAFLSHGTGDKRPASRYCDEASAIRTAPLNKSAFPDAVRVP